MARRRETFCLITGGAWLLFSGAVARAYEEQASLDLALGYALFAASASLPAHGLEFDLGAGFGLADFAVLRANFGYASLFERGRLEHAGRVRVEGLYLLDVLQVVPFFGLGADLLAGEGRDGGVELRPGGHIVFGVDYLASRAWIVGADLRSGLLLEGHRGLSATDVSLRVSRMFETF